MEVCLEFETRMSALPHMNLFLDLSCAFLNTDRPTPFAFEKDVGNGSGAGGKRGLRSRVAETNARQKQPCPVEKWQPSSSPGRPWFCSQPVVIALRSLLLFLPSNLGPEALPAIGLG